ncbi:MAG: Plug and carboxypeptidase regulatory-like domain-containing protein [Acidobacteria bacterium]|nr:Plug and carboxypeptidase regulatory-like domain-containing protein [Acidobacteriota bacterium]
MKKFLTVFLFVAVSAPAQNISCLLSGTVHDPTGAVVPGAEVKLVADATGFVRTTKTNSVGFFVYPDLTASVFSLSVSAPGFKQYAQGGIEIRSGEQRSLGIVRLELGTAADTVTVTAEAAQVMAASGERAGVLQDEELSALAIKSRDIMDAVALLPGVVDTNESRESPSGDSGFGIYISGARENNKNMTIDGISNIDIGDARTLGSVPSMSSVAELKVLMTNYSAESGRNSGGAITVITRGGGKSFHANAGWYHRHEQFTANNYFNNRNKIGRPRYRYNIFDYNLSGPIYIPGKFNADRSKLFFFFSHEIQEQLVARAATTRTVPTPLERNGDFSQTYDVNGRLVPITDALNDQIAFPGNVIPASRINRVGQAMLKLFPEPNFVDPEPARRYQWNHITNPSYPSPRRVETLRTDFSPRENLQMYARVNLNSETQTSYYLGGPTVPLPTTNSIDRPAWLASLHGTATITPTIFNEFVFGVTSLSGPRWLIDDPASVSRKATGIELPQWYPANNTANIIPAMTFGGVANVAGVTLSYDFPGYTNSVSITLSNNISKIYHTHSIKAGIYFERSRKNRSVGTAKRGVVNMSRDRANPLDSNYAFSNALTGVFQSYTEATAQPWVRLRFTNLEWYLQDDWRVRPRFFLNYGLRVYHDGPQDEEDNEFYVFLPQNWEASAAPTLLRPAYNSAGKKVALDPVTGATFRSNLVGTYALNRGNFANGMTKAGTRGLPNALADMPRTFLGPRLGFAWNVAGKTVLRGGGGVYFNRSVNSPWTYMGSTPPRVYTPTIYYGTFDTLLQTADQAVVAPGTVKTFLTGPDQKPECAYNASFGVQQSLGPRSSLDVSYVGSFARHLWWVRNINPVPIGAQYLDRHPENRDPTTANSALPPNFLRPFVGYGDITAYEMAGNSNYHSLQASFRQRVKRGSVTVAYTFARNMGTATNWDTSVSPFFPPTVRNYGRLSYDRNHVFSMSYYYRLPEPGRIFQSRLLGVVTDNWELSGITRISTGAPFTPGISTVDGANLTGTPSEAARPDVANPGAANERDRFGRPAPGTMGNTGSNVLRGPGLNNWDLSVYRRIPLGKEGRYLQLRFETYNTMNHTQFSSVSGTARFDAGGNQVDPLFLTPTAARSARRVQLALRLAW